MPMRVFQVLITDSPIGSVRFAATRFDGDEERQGLFSDTTYQLFQRPEIESFLSQHFDRGVLNLFVV